MANINPFTSGRIETEICTFFLSFLRTKHLKIWYAANKVVKSPVLEANKVLQVRHATYGVYCTNVYDKGFYAFRYPSFLVTPKLLKQYFVQQI